MNKILVFIIFIFSTCAVNSDPVNDFHYAKATTNVKNIILQDQALRDLDYALNIIYKKACELSTNKQQIKFEQIAWLKNSSSQFNIETHGNNLKYDYKRRALDLLRDPTLRSFYLKDFINAPLKNNIMISILAIIAQIEADFAKELWLSTIENMVIEPLIMPITKQTIIVALMIIREPYRKGYNFIKVFDTGKKIKLESFFLPQTKTFKLKFLGNSRDSIVGNFNLIKQNDKYLLSYNKRPSKRVYGDSCVWQIDADGVRIIEEIMYNQHTVVK